MADQQVVRSTMSEAPATEVDPTYRSPRSAWDQWDTEVPRNGTQSAARVVPPRQLRMLTARDTTTATVTNEARDWNIINSFDHGVSGIVSVGLNAVAFVNDV